MKPGGEKRNNGADKLCKKINDGIVRPSGQVTQVAPDDWVFAARDIGDIAAAFMPQRMAPTASGPVEISINQNFTISGSNDMPQVIKQQAYKGTYAGLQEMLNQAGTKMQLLPGLR